MTPAQVRIPGYITLRDTIFVYGQATTARRSNLPTPFRFFGVFVLENASPTNSISERPKPLSLANLRMPYALSIPGRVMWTGVQKGPR